MRKLFTLLLTITILGTSAYAENIYENKQSTQITKGVLHESIETYNSYGWQSVDVIKIDLTDEDLEVKVLSPQGGSSSLSTVKQMSEDNDTKASINGDFFNFSSGETNMLGMTVSDGELISTPSKDKLATFALTDDASPLFGYFSYTGTLYAENTSLIDLSSCELYQINKVPITSGGITMITSAWGDAVTIPINNYAMVTEPYAENQYKMTGFSWGGEKVSIPKGGAVFTANYSVNAFLNTNFAMGDIIRVETVITPDASKIKEAIGGNTLIVENGQICSFTNDIPGQNPRTALGVSASGDTLYMVTVDGRQEDCPGFTQTELANFMIELGCRTAINLDGGGSTTMVTKDKFTDTQAVQNNVSSLRRVSNALGVTSSLAPLSKPVSGDIKLSRDTVVCGDSVDILYYFNDKNYNKIPSPNAVITTTDKSAEITGNSISFSSKGEHTVYVTSEDVVLSAKVLVLGDIFAINIYPETVSATDGNKEFTVTAYDQNGHSAEIPSALVKFIHSDTLKMNGNVLLSTSSVGTVTAEYMGLTSNAAVNGEAYIKDADVAANDIFCGVLNTDKKITVSGKTDTPKTLIGLLQNKWYIEALSKEDTLYATSQIEDKWGILGNHKQADAFSETVIENSRIVTISTAGTSILKADPSAWKKISNICNGAPEKNIVLIFDTSFYNFNGSEMVIWDYYMNILTSKNRNVFCVSPGTKSEATVKGGVRYLYVGGVGNCSTKSFFYGLEQSKPLDLYFSGDEIKYSYK